MPALSFIEFVFPQFSAMNWRLGIGIYRAGGITSLNAGRELISAKVKAGIGENYDTRLKLHSQGKCVQWMECTCQAYRRHNEKCPHLAAFCIFLDQERSEVLKNMNLGAGDSDKYLFGSRYGREENGVEDRSLAAEGPVGITPSSRKEEDPTPVWERNESEVIRADISEEEPLLLLSVQLREKQQLTYCLGVDDAARALKLPQVQAKFTAKLRKIQSFGHTAKRIFEVRAQGGQAIRVLRSVVLCPRGETTEKIIPVEKIPSTHMGRFAFFIKNYGYVPFADEMNPTQISRWQEYPATAVLEGDTAALLFENHFSRLGETAEVRMGEELGSLTVQCGVKFEELRLKSTLDGQLLIDTNLVNNGTLLALVKARAEGRQFLATKSGWVKLTGELNWLSEKMQSDGKIKLSVLEFIKFREQFAQGSEISGSGPVVERMRAGLISLKDLVVPSLADTNLNLRGYQEEGLRWLWWIYQNGLGGLLADEMGLGKTHQAMALIHAIAKEEPGRMTLVVCPTSVIDHWIDKFNRFVPGIDVICYHGTGRKVDSLHPLRGHRVIVTSYGIILRDAELFSEKSWALVLLDEAHLVKNQTTRTYRAACKIPSQMRLCLTGTPLENDLMELKNLFDYILPSYLESDNDFRNRYLADTSVADPLADLELQRIIHPFKMRRKKVDVLRELPEKVEDLRYCHLKKDQHNLYVEALSLKGAALVESIREGHGPIPYVHVFSVITLLKQICNDPALIDPRYDGMGSGKLDVLDELLDEALASDHKVVVFSQYAKMIARLSQRLGQRGISHVTLTGSTTRRGDVVRKFQEDNSVKIFLGSLLAGGAGIDLTAANVVIHFDRWWNAAKENQATDRIHRIGQVKNVQVYKLITKGTLEERIDEIINRKRLIFDRFVGQDTDVFKHLSREDILQLLARPSEEPTAYAEMEPEETASPVGYEEVLC